MKKKKSTFVDVFVSLVEIITVNRYSKIGRAIISPSFIVLLFIAAGLWFLSRLSHTYSAQIMIPVELVVDYNSEVWVEQKTLQVQALVQGDGRDLLLYKLGMGSSVSVPVSSLQLTQDQYAEPYMYSVGEKSMERALTTAQNKFVITMITDTISRVRLSLNQSVRLPLVSQVEVNCAEQYMMRGGVVLAPDSVTVKAPLAILDTLHQIFTERVVLNNVNSSQSSAVALQIPQYVVAEQSIVRYMVEVVGYTEQRYRLPIASGIKQRLIVGAPSTVDVVVRVPLNVSSGFPTEFNAVLADEPTKVGGNIYRVLVNGVPSSSSVVRQEPKFVEAYTIE